MDAVLLTEINSLSTAEDVKSAVEASDKLENVSETDGKRDEWVLTWGTSSILQVEGIWMSTDMCGKGGWEDVTVKIFAAWARLGEEGSSETTVLVSTPGKEGCDLNV